MIYSTIQHQDIDLVQEYAALRSVSSAVGAIATFLGTMRDLNEVSGSVAHVHRLTLEHYPGMTERSLQTIAEQAHRRFDAHAVRVIHRIGCFAPADTIVWVGIAASHRQAAFDGCAFVMDYLKTQAPFWKKENTPDGDRWVDARQADADAMKKWLVKSE